MNLIKFNPFPVTDSLGSFIDDVFNRSISDFVGSDIVMSRPLVNITDFEDRIEISLAAPGLEKSDFNIEIDHDKLVVSVSREEQKETTGNGFTRKEFDYSAFSRSFHLPEEFDRDAIQAGYVNGVLNIAIGKKSKQEQAPTGRVIEVQ